MNKTQEVDMLLMQERVLLKRGGDRQSQDVQDEIAMVQVRVTLSVRQRRK